MTLTFNPLLPCPKQVSRLALGELEFVEVLVDWLVKYEQSVFKGFKSADN